MNHWAFVIAAYAVTLIGAAIVTLASWRAMHVAERQADTVSDRS